MLRQCFLGLTQELEPAGVEEEENQVSERQVLGFPRSESVDFIKHAKERLSGDSGRDQMGQGKEWYSRKRQVPLCSSEAAWQGVSGLVCFCFLGSLGTLQRLGDWDYPQELLCAHVCFLLMDG